jgi:hypothetical protein
MVLVSTGLFAPMAAADSDPVVLRGSTPSSANTPQPSRSVENSVVLQGPAIAPRAGFDHDYDARDDRQYDGTGFDRNYDTSGFDPSR